MPARVLVVSHAREVGGAERWLTEVVARGAEPLRARLDAAFEVVCRTDPALDGWAGELAAAGAPVHRLDVRRPRHLWRLRRLLAGAALVHLNLSFAAGWYQAVAAVGACLAGRPLVVFHHLPVEPELLPGRAWAWFARRLGRLATAHAAVSRPGAATLVARYGFPDRVAVFPVPVDLDRLRPPAPAEREAARRELGVAEGERLVVAVARLNPQKGLLDLVAAAEASEPCWRFVVLGEGEQRPELEAAIASGGLGCRVGLAGRRPAADVERWLAAADAFVLPSHFEGMPTTLLEALARGCPVVATAVGGVPDLALPAAMGRVVPPGRPDALAAALREVLAAPREPVPDDLRRRVLAGHEAGRAAAAVVDLYAGALA